MYLHHQSSLLAQLPKSTLTDLGKESLGPPLQDSPFTFPPTLISALPMLWWEPSNLSNEPNFAALAVQWNGRPPAFILFRTAPMLSRGSLDYWTVTHSSQPHKCRPLGLPCVTPFSRLCRFVDEGPHPNCFVGCGPRFHPRGLGRKPNG